MWMVILNKGGVPARDLATAQEAMTALGWPDVEVEDGGEGGNGIWMVEVPEPTTEAWMATWDNTDATEITETNGDYSLIVPLPS